MLEDVLNILIHCGISIDVVSSDPFNLTVVGKKRSDAEFELTKIKGSDSKIEIQKNNILDYYKKMELTNGNIVTCIFPAATVILAKHD